jgi:hypothetical protein
MQPEEVSTPNPETTQIPEKPPVKKKGKQYAQIAFLMLCAVAGLLAVTPRRSGHGASQSSRLRLQQRNAEINRTIVTESNQSDDLSQR